MEDMDMDTAAPQDFPRREDTVLATTIMANLSEDSHILNLAGALRRQMGKFHRSARAVDLPHPRTITLSAKVLSILASHLHPRLPIARPLIVSRLRTRALR